MSESKRGATTVDAGEVARFEEAAERWWDAAGPMRALHRLNPVRLAYIRDTACRHFGRNPRAERPLDGLAALDIGCGGGVLSEPLARLGANVVGIDPAPTNIQVARRHAAAAGVPVDYRAGTAEEHLGPDERFDLVMAMEVVEHVADVEAFVRLCAGAVRPGGLLVLSTINRTLRAFALAIVSAEYVLGWLPKGTHSWDKFVTPGELRDAVGRQCLGVLDVSGVVYHPLADAWRLSSDTGVNYMLTASRP